MSFPTSLVPAGIAALAEHEVATAFEKPAEVHVTVEEGTSHPLGFVHRGVSSIGKLIGGFTLGGPIMAGISIAALCGGLVAAVGGAIHTFHGFEERLREEGRQEVRASVNAATIRIKDRQIEDLNKQVAEYTMQISDLEATRRADAVAKARLLAAAEEASNAIAASPSKCMRPDAVIDAINRVIK